jgi:hypothetical protein
LLAHLLKLLAHALHLFAHFLHLAVHLAHWHHVGAALAFSLGMFVLLLQLFAHFSGHLFQIAGGFVEAGGAEVFNGFEQVLEFFPAFGGAVFLAFVLAFLPCVLEFFGEALCFVVLPSALKLADLLFHPCEAFFVGEA